MTAEKQSDLKMGGIDIFFQRRHQNDYQTREKMLNIANHQENTSKSHSETSHTS